MVTLKNYINRVHYCTYNIQLFIVLPYVCFVEFLFLARMSSTHLSIHQWSVLFHPAACRRSEVEAKEERERERTQFQFSNISANGLALLPSAIPTESSSRSYKITL